MATKRTTVYCVERSDWFGGCEVVRDNLTKQEAVAAAKELSAAAAAVEDPDDHVVYRVESYVWERDA